ncbi:MAG: DUF4381 domain-containing protein [Halioglobus sp.]|nr:DUF4381 domain-containing protein [Halioglobus sp.]
MSAPPLPEAFGNYALHDFVEIVSPPAISWVPQTLGWWWLGGAVLTFLAWRAWRALRHWYRNRYRREAAARLRALPSTAGTAVRIEDINRLLKLAALVAYSRETVARLSGAQWVEFLNRQCQNPPFSPQQARLLALGSYRDQALDTTRARALIDASLVWVREHGGRCDD